MTTENGSPSSEPATTPRGRGRGRGGRGRGRGTGRGASTASTRAATTTLVAASKSSRGRSHKRRGKGKTFADPRVQAAHERTTDLKKAFSVVGQMLRTALTDLADRSIEDLVTNPQTYKNASGYQEVIDELKHLRLKKQATFGRRLEMDLQRAKQKYQDEVICQNEQTKNAVADLEDRYLDGVENRLRILENLHARDLPVDLRDDQYEYKFITDEQLEKEYSGHVEAIKDGHIVPYPARVEGTERWQIGRDIEAAIAAANTATGHSARGRGRGRNAGTTLKRKAGEQPDEQPTPKRSGRNGGHGTTKFFVPTSAAPAPAKGLLASAAPQPGPDLEMQEESAPVSPDAGPEDDAIKDDGKPDETGVARGGSPGPPKWAGTSEMDEHGVCTYRPSKAARDKGAASRIFAPRIFKFEDWEIGYRDGSNDPSNSRIPAGKRGKYLHTPHNNGQHLDFWANGYDYSQMTPEDFDQEQVKRLGLHPRFGIVLRDSVNPKETPDPYVMPGKPLVFVAEPSGDAVHASRSFQVTTSGRTLADAPLRSKIGASLRGFCKKAGIEMDQVAIDDYLPSKAELQERSLGTVAMIPEKTESPAPEPSTKAQTPEQAEQSIEADKAGLDLLSTATAFVEAQLEAEAAEPEPVPTPKPTRYDAIRDVFTENADHGAPPRAQERAPALTLLADLCHAEERGSVMPTEHTNVLIERHPFPVAFNEPFHEAPVMESDVRSTIKPEREHSARPFNRETYPVRPEQYELAQGYHGHGHEVHSTARPVPPAATHSAVPVETLQYHAGAPAPPATHLPGPPTNYQGHHYPSPFPSGPPPPPPQQEPPQATYYHGHHAGYTQPEPRERRESYPSFRLSDYGYNPRPSSAYPPEISAYSQRGSWSQHPNVGPPGPPSSVQPPGPPSQPPPHQPYAAPLAPAQPRLSLSATLGDPLPPLRPPRSRTQSIPEDVGYEASVRAAPHPHPPPAPAGTGSYFPSPQAPQPGGRTFHHAYPEQMPLQTGSERAFPSPLNQMNSFGTSPQQSYAQPVSSPTFAHHPYAPGGQSPPTTPIGAPGSAHRHRSTPSGSSDAGSRAFRKLQPAPVPAHRASWANKPELKTIPYDHKETGAAAQLPSSGPTQIRGWNVNQHKKRNKPGGERADSVSERDDPR